MANANSGNLVLSFEIYKGEEHLRSEEISQESVTIGKGPAAMLRVEDDSLAELHAVINVNDDGTVQLLDLGGPGGTTVNNEGVQNSNLRNGDEIQLGATRIVVSIIDPEAFAEESATQVVDQGTEEEVTQNVTEESTSPKSPEFIQPEQIESEISEDVMAFLMRSGSAQGEAGLDTSKPKVLEVAEVWGDTVLDIRHYPIGGDPVTAGTSTGYRWRFIGIPVAWVPKAFATFSSLLGPTLSESEEEWKNDYYVPNSCLPHDDYDLFEWEGARVGGSYVCNISDKWSGFVDIGEERHSFSDLIESGQARASGPGQFQVTVNDNTRIVADLGDVVFFGQMVHSSRRVASPIGKSMDFPFLAIMSFFVFIMGMLIFYIEANKDNVEGIVVDVEELAENVSQLEDEDIEEEEEEEEAIAEEKEPEDEEAGEKREGEEGLAGKPEALMEKAKGNPENLEEQQADKDVADEAGALGAWDDLGADSGATGTGLDGVEGPIGLNMGVVGDQQGGYGFSDRGGGGGGGGTSVDGVGMGTHGRGTGRAGYGEGGGGTGGKRTASLKRVGGEAIILGALDKSLIDKVIKQNQAKFLYCYQRELVKDPNLKGKVTLNFTISADGSVAKSSTYKTTLKNSNAEGCMNSQMKMLRFPEPKGGGIVIVKYPFVYSAG